MPTLASGFEVLRDGFSFANSVGYQVASPEVFEETFGAEQIARCNRLPKRLYLNVFRDFYLAFFQGRGAFQASGLCSGLSAHALERFIQREPLPSYTLAPTPEVCRQLTVQMGRILGREILNLAYDQCARGLKNIAPTLQAIQSSFEAGLTLENAQALWFLPSGGIGRKEFVRLLGNAHSVVPYALTSEQDGATNRWQIAIYDVNLPGDGGVRVEVEQQGKTWTWRHNREDWRFSSAAGMTLAAIPLSQFLTPATFPFSGRFGLMGFIYELLT
jgi:hypothetical protein